MKKITIIILFLSEFLISNGQTYNVTNFNPRTFECVLFKEMNMYRKNKKIDTLSFSLKLFLNVSLQNVREVNRSPYLYHPDVDLQSLKNKFIEDKKNKDSYLLSSTNLYGEIGLINNIYSFDNYQDLAKNCIQRWEKSRGHYIVMTAQYKLNNTIGNGSCASIVNPKNGNILVFFNFYTLSL